MRFQLILSFIFLSFFSAYSQTENNEIVGTGPEVNYKGGFERMYKTISDNIMYPQSAVTDSVSGTVYLNLTVNEKGEIEKVKVAKGVRHDLDAEAVRVAYLLDEFIPAKQNGKPIKIKFILPVKFVLKD